MAERFEATADDPGTGMLAKQANVAGSFVNKALKMKELAMKEAYQKKIDMLLYNAKIESSKGYTYKYPDPKNPDPTTVVCDTFLKKIFYNVDNSISDVSGTYAMYNKYKSSILGSINPVNNKFSITGTPMEGDIVFFLDDAGKCLHVGIFIEYNKDGTIDIYEASLSHVGRNVIYPSSFKGQFGYTSMVFAHPFLPQK